MLSVGAVRFNDLIEMVRMQVSYVLKGRVWRLKMCENVNGCLPDGVTYVGTDVSQDVFIDVLVQAGFNPNEKSVFLLQGLIYYMEPKGVDILFNGLGKIL